MSAAPERLFTSDQAERLLAAARMVDAVTDEISVETTRCEHCDRVTYSDWLLNQAKIELTAAQSKIKRWAERERARPATEPEGSEGGAR